MSPLDEYSPMVEEMKQMMQGNTKAISENKQEDIYSYLLHGAESLVKDHPDLVQDIWNCSSCEHTKDECDEETYEKIKEIIDKVKEKEK